MMYEQASRLSQEFEDVMVEQLSGWLRDGLLLVSTDDAIMMWCAL